MNLFFLSSVVSTFSNVSLASFTFWSISDGKLSNVLSKESSKDSTTDTKARASLVFIDIFFLQKKWSAFGNQPHFKVVKLGMNKPFACYVM